MYTFQRINYQGGAVAAIVLLVGAVLKALYPISSVDYVLAFLEATLGIWLFVRKAERTSFYIAVASFGVFAGVSAAKAWAALPTCNCFGSAVMIPPPIMFLVDVIVLVGLLIVAPARPFPRPNGWGLATITVTMTFLAASQFVLPEHETGVQVFAQATVVWPEKLVGRPFPLLGEVVGGVTVSRGTWDVLLYHPECSHCQTAIQWAQSFTSGGSGRTTCADCSQRLGTVRRHRPNWDVFG